MLGALLLIIGISEILLGILVLKVGYNKLLNQLFFVFAIVTGFWVVTNYLIGYAQTIFWLRLAYGLGALIYGTSCVWILKFTYPRIRNFWPGIIFSSAIIIFVLTLQEGLIINNVTKLFYGGFTGTFGWLFLPYTIFSALMTAIIFVIVFKGIKQSSGIKKQQHKYIAIGYVAFGLGALLTSFIIPTFGKKDSIPLDSIASLPLLLAISYTIYKHRLLDFKILILRTVSFSLVFAAVTALLLAITLFITQQLTRTSDKIWLTLALSGALILIINPLQQIIAKLTDRFFFKASVHYDVLLRQLSEIINKEIDLSKLLLDVEVKLLRDFKIQLVKILMPKFGGSEYVSQSEKDGRQIVLNQQSPLIKYLNRETRTIIKETLERRIEDTTEESVRVELERSKEELDKLNAAVVSPVVTSDGRIAAVLVLGGKLSGDPYSNDDLNLLQLLGPQLASALEKARLYEEIRLFNVKLQKEVEIATERVKQKNVLLEDRNRFLSAVQKVTNLITQTLEFKRVTQSIVDAIATELGFVGGLLLFLGESRRKVFPEAVTKSPVTDKVLAMLPKALKEYWGDYTVDRTMNIEAMKVNQVRISTELSDFLSPPVPKLVCGAVQKFAGIKTIISVPIVAESEVVGCIDFFIAKEPSLITKTERDMMQAMANQTGVVYRNIELVRRLEESNNELGEANEHLKELDQAKSEFVSIASHQLRTPMTGIMGYLSMIVGGDFGKIDASLQKVLESLLDASQRMIRLINLFLDVTKIESGKLVLDKRPTQLEDLIEKELDVLKKLASDKGLKLIYKRPKAKLPLLSIDDKITDVVLNLVDNAIKYTPKGSITITSERESDVVHVKVQDTGRGLEPKEARGLFNKFVRGYGIAQVNPDGSGLGLYVARRIIEVHGGKIWVESDGTGKGSCFQFTLPINPINVTVEAQGVAKVGKK